MARRTFRALREGFLSNEVILGNVFVQIAKDMVSFVSQSAC